jgi:Skp family chaperone for outer membrane proteins
MSDESTIATGSSDVSATPTSDAVSTPAPDAAPSGSGDVFASLDVEGIFNLPKSDGQDTESPDVPQVANPPIPRQDANEVEKQSTEKVAEQPTSPDASQTDTQSSTTGLADDKLDWKTAPEQFREKYEALKDWAQGLASESVQGQFLAEPKAFAEWMKETSPTSYNEVGGILATESAQAHPDKWIDFLASTPAVADMMAERLSGREGMTAERLKAELEVVLDSDDPDVQAAMERQKAESAEAKKQPIETPEQKEVRQWREEKARENEQKNLAQVFDPIEKEVNSLISEAGLEVDLESVKGKQFSELDADTQAKVFFNSVAAFWIEQRVNADPKLANMQARMQEFLKAGDVKSALNLQHPAKIAVTNAIREALAVYTAQRAKLETASTIPPTTDDPPAIVKGAGAGSLGTGADKPVSDADWTVTNADFKRR